MDISTFLNICSRKNIDNKKLKALSEVLSSCNINENDKNITPVLLAACAKLNSMNVNFTDSETDIIVEAIKSDLNDADKQRLDTIRMLSKQNFKKKTQ